MVWIIPAGIAFAVFLLFALLFNDKNKAEEAIPASIKNTKNEYELK